MTPSPDNRPWLVTGAAGMLGRDLVALLERRGAAVVARDLPDFDISREEAVLHALAEIEPRTIVNCAAFTKVDDCEVEVALARRVNGEAVATLARGANRVGATLVQISSDYVFDGRSGRPYLEDDPPSPLSEYGRSKLLGEESARRADEHLVVRTSWLYGASGWNFIEALRKQVDGGKGELSVVDDQVGSPTATTDLAEAIADLVGAGARGTVHFTNSGSVSWFGFAREIARRLGWSVKIWPLSSEMLARPAKRPAFSVLDASRFASLTGRVPRPWTEPLGEYLERMPGPVPAGS
jgi:dTDP-4-dehydrorhamnose reductase